jgi:hypothetical protein
MPLVRYFWYSIPRRLGRFFFKYILRLKQVRRIPRHTRWFVTYYLGPFAVAFLILFIVTGQLLTSTGLLNPFVGDPQKFATLFLYDLIYARSNAQPNGSHIPSFVAVVALAWYVAIKFRQSPWIEVFLGLLAGAFLVAVHEGLWIIPYYISYAQYLDWSQLTSVLKDVAFSVMILLLFFAFRDYPLQRVRLRTFKWPVVIYVGFLLGWFFIPHLLNPTYYHDFFPITTINNYKYGHTVYAKTDWWSDPIVNSIEVASWVLLAGMFVIAIWRDSRLRSADEVPKLDKPRKCFLHLVPH